MPSLPHYVEAFAPDSLLRPLRTAKNRRPRTRLYTGGVGARSGNPRATRLADRFSVRFLILAPTAFTQQITKPQAGKYKIEGNVQDRPRQGERYVRFVQCRIVGQRTEGRERSK